MPIEYLKKERRMGSQKLIARAKCKNLKESCRWKKEDVYYARQMREH